MSKGKRSISKHSNDSERKYNKRKKRNIIKIIFVILVLALMIYCFYYFISHRKGNSSQIPNSTSSQIITSKKITGLESVEISKINIESSDNASIVELVLNNTSSSDIKSCTAHLYFSDTDGKIVIGTPINIPDIKPNSKTNFKVFCTDDVSSSKDYEIVLVEK